MRRLFSIGLAALALTLTAASSAAAFGLEDLDVAFSEADESPAKIAGSHPFAQTTSIAFETVADPDLGYDVPNGNLKDLTVSLPAGFVGNLNAIEPCANIDFAVDACPDSSKVGLTDVFVGGPPQAIENEPVFLLAHAPGAAAKLGFHAIGVPVTIDLRVNPAPPYNVLAALRYNSNAIPIYSSEVTIFGEPAGATMPFLTLPRACQGPSAPSFEGVSWEQPEAAPATGVSASALEVEDCSSLGFGPTIAAAGNSSGAESPSGLDFDLEVDDPGLTEAGGRADSDIEKVVVDLPEGFTTNPSVAAGLETCSTSRYEAEGLAFDPATGCPEASKVGTVEVTTPLLAETLQGQIYVAEQRRNPFGSLLGLYIVIRDESLGILVKQAVKVEPNPATGRLTTTVEGIPQLPFSRFHLHFRSGSRAPLITPPLCGDYNAMAALYPYTNPGAEVTRNATLTVNSGAGGAPCAPNLASLPHAPGFTAGTVASKAGAYSPFVLELSRADGSQHLSSISTTLPQGMLGRLAGVAYCPEAGIAQAASRTEEGQGALELSAPSCPSSSRVGSVMAASGAGPDPLYVPGTAYLAGPYKGAPLSLLIVTPAIAGPFDLGVVAVRTALNVDPRSTQITAVSDPLPTILHGLPLDVRKITVSMDRPDFTLNPTSCEPKQVTGSAVSTEGAVASLATHFQASDCRALAFKPELKLRLKGATRRAGHPSLKAVLTFPKTGSSANIASARVGLPHSEFLDQGSIGAVCTQPQLLSRTCPKASIYGRAKAWSPLLDKPLEGPVYLGVGYGHELPDLVADLDGQIRVLVNGKVDTTPKKGLRNTFELVPDAPVSRFVLELKGGRKKGLLENSENLCSKPQRAQARFVAQNGRIADSRVELRNDCGRKKGKKK